MDPHTARETLGRFGLSDREASLYLAALRRGLGTARELTRDAQVDRVLGYRLLDSMRARGLVEVTAERPRRFSPIPPAVLIERDVRARKAKLAEDETIGRELAQSFETAALPPSSGAARYQLLTGATRIYDQLYEMIRRAEQEMFVMLTFRGLRESLARGFSAEVGPFIRKGGRFRMLLESDPRLAPTLARFRRVQRRFPRVEIRESVVQPVRLTIVDRAEALLFIVPEAPDRSTDHVAIWTEHSGFIEGHRAFFGQAWRTGHGGPVVKPRTHRR